MTRKILFMILALAVLNGCTYFQQDTQPSPSTLEGQQEQHQPEETYPLTVNVNGNDLGEVTAHVYLERTYVPLVTVLEFMDYQVFEDEEQIRSGFTDVIHEVHKDSARALFEDEELTLSSPVVTYEGQTFITTDALPELLGPESEVRVTDQSLAIDITDSIFPEDDDLANIEDEEEIPALSRSKANDIVATARRFIGRPYQFGARSGNTSVFDCSSFTQYVFHVNGVSLPRNSRQQAAIRHTNRARYIPVSSLRRGDLVFFYWPGRFSSNRIVGHVAIYLGNGYVIQATPSRGVHIANAAGSSYWRSTYLGAVRVSG